MVPPAGPGQRVVLKTHYERLGEGPVAYLDETYSIEKGRKRFYVMSAVIVAHQDRDPLRNEIDDLVPDGWWHTTDELKSDAGRERTRELLRTLRTPDEACIVVDKIDIASDDKDGTKARGAVLARLLETLNAPIGDTHPPIRLVVSEEQREARMNNYDRSIRKQLLAAKKISIGMEWVQASPGAEHLLWLPDLACSAYRQKMLHRKSDLFAEIEDLTTVIELS